MVHGRKNPKHKVQHLTKQNGLLFQNIMQIGDRFIHNIIAVYVIVQIFQHRICRGPKLFLPVIRQLN